MYTQEANVEAGGSGYSVLCKEVRRGPRAGLTIIYYWCRIVSKRWTEVCTFSNHEQVMFIEVQRSGRAIGSLEEQFPLCVAVNRNWAGISTGWLCRK